VTPPVDLKEDMRLYRRLLGYAVRYRWMFPVALIGMLLNTAAQTGVGALMKSIVDDGFIKRDASAIEHIPLFLFLLVFARGIGSFLAEYTSTWISRKVIFDLRSACFERLLKLPCGYFDLNASGRLVSKLIYDVEQIAGAATQGIVTIIGDGLSAIALVGYLLYLDWRLTALLFIVTPVSAFLIRQMSKGFRRKSQKIQLSVGEISSVTQETADGHRVIKAFGGEAQELRFFVAANELNRRQIMRKAAISAAGMPIVQLVAAVGLAVMIRFALTDPTITAGAFTGFLSTVALLSGSLRRLAKINEVIQTGLSAAQSAFSLLDEPVERDDGTATMGRTQGRVEYRDVTFRYTTANDNALRGVSFAMEPGQTLALVGASGSGKTTLAGMLPRFYRATGGKISLDGIDINDLVLADLRRQIALVGQDTLLFNDSLAANIAYGSEGAIDAQRLRAAAQAAHVLEFAERLPEGLDTKVGERGALLSGGQRQRVAIARALYKDAPILVLDEATSALDSESERLVQDAMQRLRANRTTLVIAHRLSTIEHADRIVVMARGEVVESGTHRELLARGGAYASLYNSQFSAT